jgi:MFS family permease
VCAALDATVVNIALPTIGRDFHTGIAALQWVMTSYILTLTAFLLIGGSLGVLLGRRKVYLIGIVWFALASAACCSAGGEERRSPAGADEPGTRSGCPT